MYGFTPDCKFPVVYAERGRALIRVKGQELEPFFAFVTEYFIGAKNTGDRLGIDFCHEEYGVMEMRGYKLGVEDGTPYFEAALSYPAGRGVGEILERIREKAGRPLSERKGLHPSNLSTFLPLWKPKFWNTLNGASVDRQFTFIIPVCLIIWWEKQ